jgi:hypothetical protein
MRYVYPKKINIQDLIVIELKDKYIIKNNSLVNLYGIIIKLDKFKIIKEYSNYKIITENDDLNKYEDFLSENIKNYKKIMKNNEIILSDRNTKRFIDDEKELYLNIHYVKKTGFLNIPKISIL